MLTVQLRKFFLAFTFPQQSYFFPELCFTVRFSKYLILHTIGGVEGGGRSFSASLEIVHCRYFLNLDILMIYEIQIKQWIPEENEKNGEKELFLFLFESGRGEKEVLAHFHFFKYLN